MLQKNKEQAIRTIQEVGESDLVPTIAPIDKIVAVVQQVEQLKKKLSLDEEVIYYDETGKVCSKENAIAMYVPRKPLRTYMLAFNLSSEIVDEQRFENEDSEGKYYVWRYKVRVSMANGRYIEQIGACSSRDPFFSKRYGERIEPDEANIMEKAMTSALNRAISDILGGTIPTEEDIRLRYAEYLLKKKAGITEKETKKKKRGRPKKTQEKTQSSESKVEEPATKPISKPEPATKTSEDILINLILDPVFTDKEREKICDWIDKGQTEEAIKAKIEAAKREIESRRKVLEKEKQQDLF